MSLIEKISPSWALKREVKRAQLQLIKNYSQSGASTSQNWARGTYSTPNSPLQDIEENIDTLHGRARHMYMANSLARGPVNKIRTNVVGSGLTLSPKPDAKLLNLTDEQAADWERLVKAEFSVWADSKDCDASRRQTFGQLQGLTLISAMVNGDVFALLPANTLAGQPYSLRVQLIEADRIRTPMKEGNNKKVIAGIETGNMGESVAAFIMDDYTGDDHKRIPFYGDNGTPLLLQISQDWERVGQVRGVSAFAPIMEILVQIDRYTKAELMANIVAAFCTVFIETEAQAGSFMQGGIQDIDKIAPEDDSVIELGNGNIIQGRPGEKFNLVNPTRTNTSFDSVMQNYIRQLGIGLEMPYEVLVAHFQSSYSAARGALQEAWKMYSMRRDWLVQTFCQPIYEQWLTEAVGLGRIQANGFFDDPVIKAAWCKAQWIGPAQTSLNPAQEANANKTNLEIGVDTRENIIQRTNGMTFDQVNDTLRRELEDRKRAGLQGVDNEQA